mgnify:CR=1 FL=1
MSLEEAVCARDLKHNQLIYRPLSVTCNICGFLTDISLARIFFLMYHWGYFTPTMTNHVFLLVSGFKSKAYAWRLWSNGEQGEIFIVPHLRGHGASVYTASSERPLHLVALYDKPELLRTYSMLDPHVVKRWANGAIFR